MKSESACMWKVELWVAVLRGRQVAGRPAGRPHYRRLSMYELIDFNGFRNVQVVNFTGLIATFRFPTVTKANHSEKLSVQCWSCKPLICGGAKLWSNIRGEECESRVPDCVRAVSAWLPNCYCNCHWNGRGFMSLRLYIGCLGQCHNTYWQELIVWVFCNVWVFWLYIYIYTVLWLRFLLTWLRFLLPWLRFIRVFSSVVRQMPG